ncbi:MAG: phosphotransferase [Alphaproteobacteria bacterium]
MQEVQAALARIPLFQGNSLKGIGIERLAGLTNRNYKVSIGGESYVLRIAGEGTGAYIDRAAEEHHARVAAEAGVNAEVLYFDRESGNMLCRFIEGAVTMDAERFRDLGAVRRAAIAMRRLHTCAKPFLARIDVFEKIDEYLALLRRSDAPIPEGYEEVQKKAEVVRRLLDDRPVPLAPCHNDPVAENFLDTGERMYVVDWEYSGMNDPMWDLGDVSVEAEFGDEQDDALMDAYFDGEPPAAQVGRMVLYKAMSDLIGTLWGVIQVVNENRAEDFWAYAVNRFERCRTLMGSADFGRHLKAAGAGT